MSGWRITAWNREHARGAVTSGLGTLPFDASVAVVDAFTIGEAVEVSLLADGPSWKVTKVVPVAWRRPASPEPAEDFRATLTAIDRVLAGRAIWLSALSSDVLSIAVEADSYAPTQTIELAGVEFLQMPATIDAVARLSAYDASRFAEVSPDRVRGWPSLPPKAFVFCFEPLGFNGAAGYVVAWKVSLVTR
jgi:hypothetical protein